MSVTQSTTSTRSDTRVTELGATAWSKVNVRAHRVKVSCDEAVKTTRSANDELVKWSGLSGAAAIVRSRFTAANRASERGRSEPGRSLGAATGIASRMRNIFWRSARSTFPHAFMHQTAV